MVTDLTKQPIWEWCAHLVGEDEPKDIQSAVIAWLIGPDPERFSQFTLEQLHITQQAMDYRYRILRQRYLGVNRAKAYQNLIQRLGSLLIVRNKIRTWIALSRDRHRTVTEVLQEIIAEMLQSDRYIQQQLTWISVCTQDQPLRNSLILATLEEYCLRPVRNQPLLAFRFVNYLRRSQRGGMTQVPEDEFIRLVSDQIIADDADNHTSRLDGEAISKHQENEQWETQYVLRLRVQQEFSAYLAEHLEPLAVEWLELYLQGHSQDQIAKTLGIPVKQVYRLREKISYHAVRVFGLRSQPELVAEWLETSVADHSLGLTPTQWQQLTCAATPLQLQILRGLQAKHSLSQLATDLGLKPDQVFSEWGKLCLAAQTLRSS